MGLLVDGVWQDEQHIARTPGGHFVRPSTRFRNWVTQDGSPGPTSEGGFAAARGRYHLYAALPCPWAHRTIIMRMLKGLEDVISLSLVEPLDGPCGPFTQAPTHNHRPPLRAEIASVNALVFENINTGVYRAGFATAQGTYED